MRTAKRSAGVTLSSGSQETITFWPERIQANGSIAGADPEFPVGGGANPLRGGANIQIFPKTA